MTAVDGPMTADQVASCVVRHDHLQDGSTSDGLDCHPAVDSGSVPHYPTSAELAAFRRSIAAHRDYPVTRARPSYLFDAQRSNAWSWERENGIGYTAGGSAYRDAHDASRARKGARLIRSGMHKPYCGAVVKIG